MQRLLTLAFLLIGNICLQAQYAPHLSKDSDLSTDSASSPAPSAPYTSVRHAESTFYSQFNFRSEAEVDSFYAELYPALAQQKPQNNTHNKGGNSEKDNTCTLQKQVYGYHPYWVSSTAAANYQYDLLSTFIYFSYEIDPNTGSYDDIHFWKTTNSINLAQAAGARVELCVTNFGASDNTTFLSNTLAWDRLIDSLIVLLPIRNADGVNIDFEGIPTTQRTNFRAFMQHLHTRLNTALPGTSVSVAMPAVDWNNIFNLTEMDSYIDAFIIMGYDYHYAGDAQAGPSAPLYSGNQWNELNYTKTLNDYLAESPNPQKIILAVPYYGYDWKTDGETIPANTTASGLSRTYSYVRQNFYDTYTYQWNEGSQTPYFMYISGGNVRQCWFDDEQSLGKRYDMINSRNIGGTGMWALGYDDGYSELWNVLREKFTDCGTPCPSTTIYDTGGSNGQYRNNEDYTINLVSPDGMSPITATFTALDLENNYDYIRVYNGNSTAAPLIATLTGTGAPLSFTSTGAALTLRFTSDGATRRDGFALQWSCACMPTAAIAPLVAPLGASNFSVNFIDTDNCGTAGISERFYQALYAPNSDANWEGNAERGFFNDDFGGGTLSEKWLAESGTWVYDNGTVQQIAQSNDNTNLYTYLLQDNSKTWLYQWRMKISGTASNRRAGLHFFASDGDAENRGNSYFVYLRADDNKVQFYKVTDNVYSLKTNDNATVLPDTWLNCKLIYNPSNGIMRFYLNNTLVSTWTDNAPLTSGSYLSLRTGNCAANYDAIGVFQSRNAALNLSIGTTADNDILHNGIGTPQVRITSIVRSDAHFSNIAFADVQFGGAVSVNTPTQSDFGQLVTYPNPATTDLYVRYNLNLGTNTPAILSLTDLSGRIIMQQNINIAAHNNNTLHLPIADLAAGTYLVSLQTAQGVRTEKVVVSQAR